VRWLLENDKFNEQDHQDITDWLFQIIAWAENDCPDYSEMTEVTVIHYNQNNTMKRYSLHWHDFAMFGEMK
jgi:hypothetical protein